MIVRGISFFNVDEAWNKEQYDDDHDTNDYDRPTDAQHLAT